MPVHCCSSVSAWHFCTWIFRNDSLLLALPWFSCYSLAEPLPWLLVLCFVMFANILRRLRSTSFLPMQSSSWNATCSGWGCRLVWLPGSRSWRAALISWWLNSGSTSSEAAEKLLFTLWTSFIWLSQAWSSVHTGSAPSTTLTSWWG